MVDDAPALPKVTPWMLRAADDMCARRLHLEYTAELGTRDPVNRSRIRNALIDALRVWHETGTTPPVGALLEPEEQRVVEHALGWYPKIFSARPVATVETPLGDPTVLPGRQVRLGGWVDLCVVRDDGTHELRQLALGAADVPVDPLDLAAVRLAVLRLAQIRWIEGPELAIVWADLLNGVSCETTVAVPDDLGRIAAWLDERLDIVKARSTTPTATPGRDCATCGFVPHCPAHDVRGAMTTRSGDILPAILAISPTALDTWGRCPREWRNRVLSIPESDRYEGTAHGLYLHQLLRFVHERGSCHNAAHVAEVVAAHGADARAEEELRRHAARCPEGATALGHEVEWARANKTPPVFMASARLDAVWEYDGVLEVRDYKTGRGTEHSVSEDTRARLQAWVAAPVAAERGLRLRVRYEHLATEIDDDPAAWEPDDDDLAEIGAQLRDTVAMMRAERVWRGVADETICVHCRYRSICPDSAATSEPAWPAVA
jgi:PD-(D/E)XK nuclease superfamily